MSEDCSDNGDDKQERGCCDNDEDCSDMILEMRRRDARMILSITTIITVRSSMINIKIKLRPQYLDFKAGVIVLKRS